MSKKEIAFYNRYMMTVDEAGAYFHIGARKMRKLVREHEGAKWMLYNGEPGYDQERTVPEVDRSADGDLK